ncbi:MAG: type II CAAX endopeptidase family protein [Bacillota bacterium]|nr:type II CAAX endopeptidase family protein [Bacillota bacterium]
MDEEKETMLNDMDLSQNEETSYSQNEYQQKNYDDTLYKARSYKKMQPDEQIRKRNKKILLRCGLSLSIMAIAIIIAQVIITAIISKFFPAFTESSWYLISTIAIPMIGVGLPVFYLLMKGLPNSDRGEVVSLSIGKFLKYFMVCSAAMYLSNFLGTFVGFLINDNYLDTADALEVIINSSNLFIRILYMSIIGPIVEEIIFRKILLDKVRRFGDLPAILFTGLAFGLFHMNLSQYFYASVLGMIFAYITINTNTIKYAILLHIMINFIGSGIVPLIIASENMVGMGLISIWVFASIVIGAIIFIRNFKRIKFNKPGAPLVMDKDYFLNFGSILFTVLCVVMIVLTL